MRNNILKLLKEKEGFTSGQGIAEKLYITRSAVNKHIKTLRKLGYTIESRHSLGYRLVNNLNFIDPTCLQRDLNGCILFKEFMYLECINSTNDEAYRLAKKECGEGTIVLSEMQTHGRGRMGKYWESFKKNNLYFSIILRPKILPSSAPIFTILSALSITEAIETTCNVKPMIKWPNDILINGKKVCGILTEMKSESDIIDFLIIGIGINVNSTTDDFSKGIRNSATTLRDAMKRSVSRENIFKSIMINLEKWYHIFMSGTNHSIIIKEWNKRSYLTGKTVTVKNLNEKAVGKVIGIDKNGFLLIKRGDKIKSVFSGTIEKVV